MASRLVRKSAGNEATELRIGYSFWKSRLVGISDLLRSCFFASVGPQRLMLGGLYAGTMRLGCLPGAGRRPAVRS